MSNIKLDALKYPLLYLIIVVGITISLYTVPLIDNTSTMMKFIAAAAIVELFLLMVAIRRICKSILVFSAMFFLVLFLFNFGQVILVAFEHTKNISIYLRYFSTEENYYAFRLINISFAMMGFGMLFGLCLDDKCCEQVLETENRELKTNDLRKKAFFLLAMTFPVKFFIDLGTLYLGLTESSNVANVWRRSIPDVIVSYGSFSIIGMGALIVALKNDPGKQRIFFWLFFVYITIMMLGGKRSENVAYICILLLLYLKTQVKKLQLKNVLLYTVVAYLFLAILSTIVYARTYLDVRNAESLFDTFLFCLIEKNPVISAMRDYGTTGYTAMCVLLKWLENFDPSHGMSYIGGFASVFPNVGDIFGSINRDSAFAFALQNNNMLDSRYFNIGGSLIGELFFNFGILGGIRGGVVVGLVIGIVSKKIDRYISNGIDYKVGYYIATASALLYWVREYFGGISREIVWSVVIWWMVNRIRI